jgi:hypothetical protein
MSDCFDAVQQRTQTDSQEVEDGDITTGVDSRADIIFKGAERARPIMVDVTSISGLSKIVNLRQYKVGGRLVHGTRGHQFVQTDVEFDRGRTRRFEENIRVVFHWISDQQSGKIGFFMMREVRNRGLGLGARMVTGLG